MTTADELLAMSSGSDICDVDWETRLITIPKIITNLGVESDDDVNKIYFRVPQYYDGTDLSTFRVRINYLNANKEGDVYTPDDVSVTDEGIEFTWIVGRHATMYKGDVIFNVCMVMVDDEGVIVQEVNTTPATLPVLEGLETTQAVVDENRDAMTAVVIEALEAARNSDLKGDPGYTPVKGVDYYTPEEEEALTQKVVQNTNGAFTNALKGTASGAVIRVDDVSPVEHTVKAKALGKNYFNVLKATTNNEVINNGDGTLTVNTSPTSAGVPIFDVTLRDLAPNLEVGKTYTLSAESTGTHKRMYFSIPGEGKPNTSIAFGGSFVATEDILRSQVFLYASGNSTTATISNIQIEEGSVATEYEPYIDPTSVTVAVCGKNMLPYPYDNMTKTLKGVTITENADGTFVANGTATGECVYFLLDNGTRYYKGKYTFSGISGGSTTTYYIQPVIDGVYKDAIFNPTTLDLDGHLTRLGFYIKSGTTLNNMKFKLQIEKGGRATSYEPYVGANYAPTSDGSVDIVSVSPTMTVMTDNSGVAIEMEYSKDIHTLLPTVEDEMYFLIDDDGLIALKPEYRGKGSASYPYSVSDNGATAAGSKNAELPSAIVIPDIVNEIAVTELAKGMFYGNEAIESLTIPDGITIVPEAFCREAKRLVEVHGTENVTELGKSSFCITRLKRAIFPNLTTMISTAFYRCVYLVVADIGNHIESVKMGTFNGCHRLSFIRGGGAITKVEKNGLVGTYRLKNLPFAGRLTTIGDNGIYMSRVNYDWYSHECEYGTNATPKQLNPTDFWSGKTFTPCENPLRSTFHQENPEWDKDVRENNEPYNHRCGAVVCATIYSALEGRDIRPADFQRDVEAIGTERAKTAAKEIAYSDRQVECFRLLGYTVNGSNDPDAPANWYRVDTNLQLLYDSLAAGHLVGLEANDGTGGNSHIVVAYGINKDGEIMVVNSSSLSEEFGDYTAIKYCMPIQNLVRASAGDNYGEFMVVERKN